MLGPLLTLGSTLLGGAMASGRQNDAQEFSADQFSRRYQIETEDMKKAGLNPMLAYTKGGGTAPSSSAASAPSHDVGASYLASKMNSAQVANVEADTQNKLESAALIRAQTAQAMSSANQADASVTKIGQEVTNLKEQFKNIPLEGNRLKALADQIFQSGELMIQQNLTQEQVRNHYRALIGKLKNETELLDLDIDAAKSLDNIGREYNQLKPIVDLIRSFIRK
jgi:hypothetical protein